MRKLALVSILVLAMAGLYLGIHHGGHHSQAPETTSPAKPHDVLLTDLDGKHFQMSDYQGKVILVNFWAAWCAPCAEEIPRFVAMQNKFRDQGLQVIGVSVEDMEANCGLFASRTTSLPHCSRRPIGGPTLSAAFSGCQPRC